MYMKMGSLHLFTGLLIALWDDNYIASTLYYNDIFLWQAIYYFTSDLVDLKYDMFEHFSKHYITDFQAFCTTTKINTFRDPQNINITTA